MNRKEMSCGERADGRVTKGNKHSLSLSHFILMGPGMCNCSIRRTWQRLMVVYRTNQSMTNITDTFFYRCTAGETLTTLTGQLLHNIQDNRQSVLIHCVNILIFYNVVVWKCFDLCRSVTLDVTLTLSTNLFSLFISPTEKLNVQKLNWSSMKDSL